MPIQTNVVSQVVEAILTRQTAFITRVGIDGNDGAGKTTFANVLAEVLAARGLPVIRSSVDGFHNPKAIRYRSGRMSPTGFYADSYDYVRLKALLLDPLSPGGTGRYVPAVFDHHADSTVDSDAQQANRGDILLFDGIFLHRPELRDYWDLSIYLDVRFERSIPRLSARDGGPLNLDAPLNRRYIEGQRRYISENHPAERASIVIDNNDPDHPVVRRWIAD